MRRDAVRLDASRRALVARIGGRVRQRQPLGVAS
jgi:hypothetical protein